MFTSYDATSPRKKPRVIRESSLVNFRMDLKEDVNEHSRITAGVHGCGVVSEETIFELVQNPKSRCDDQGLCLGVVFSV